MRKGECGYLNAEVGARKERAEGTEQRAKCMGHGAESREQWAGDGLTWAVKNNFLHFNFFSEEQFNGL